MVRVWLDLTMTEIPIADIIAKGLYKFYEDISATSEKHKYNTNYAGYRLMYTIKELKYEDLGTITDDDSLRVIPAKFPEKAPKTELFCKEMDEALKALVAPLTNTRDRRIYGFNYEFGQPDHMSKIIKAHPKLIHDPQLLAILKDWYLFRSYIVKDEFKDDPARNAFKYENPDFYLAVKRLIVTIGANYGIRFIERPANVTAQSTAAITHELLQNALQAALSGNRLPGIPVQQPIANLPGPSAPAPSGRENPRVHPVPSSMPSTSTPAPAPAAQPMEQGYETQIATLRSFGFENEELIVLALQEANGDIETAMEFLIEMNN